MVLGRRPERRPTLAVSATSAKRFPTYLRPLPTHVLIPAGVGGQRRDSMAKCEQITCLDKQFLVRGPLGRPVSDPLMSAVVRAIRRAVGEPLP